MKKGFKYILLCCFISFAQRTTGETIYQYALTFNSYEVEKESRTSLNLTPEEPLACPDGLILEFDLSFHKVVHNFGYIFRITANDNECVDLLLNRTPNNSVLEPQITAIYKSGQVLCNLTFEELGTDFNRWMKFRIEIDPKKQRFKLTVNDKSFEKKEDYFAKLKNVNIVFGKNDLISYETSDVPSMSIKDVYIKNIEEHPIFYWKLAQHTGTGVYDERKNRFASCKAPRWELDNHAYWQKTESFTTGEYPQIAFDTDANLIAIADNKTFHFYNITDRSLKTHARVTGSPLHNKSNQLYHNRSDGRFFTYNFTDQAVLYDTLSRTWSNTAADRNEPHYWHHNRYYRPQEEALYTWCGYGFHIYKNDIHRYRFSTGSWERIACKGDSIAPRYLAGLGTLDEKTVLIFGGYGSEKGDQKASPHNYYDLYSFDLETHTAKKLWELETPAQHNFVLANSLVADTSNRCFYALCFPHQKFNTTLRLYRFSIDKPFYEILADSIPYSFSDIYSYADLFLSNDGTQLAAITAYTNERNSNATVQIYTLSFPPLDRADLFQSEPRNIDFTLYIALASVILTLSGIFLAGRRRRRKSIETQAFEIDDPIHDEEDYGPIVGIKPVGEKVRKQSILLFGGFQVTDKECNNITGEFTPTLEQLFLLILLHTLKDGKGISSVKLRELLWFDKTDESAKNNRGVSLSKLRTIFEKIGEISVNGVNSYWTMGFDQAIYCDYYEALILIDRISKNADIKDINRLISIVSAGELLPNLQVEWADTFKSDISNRLIDLLLKLVDKSSRLGLSSAMVINIADTIFVHDSLNEDALSIKCSLLVQMGKNGLAQKTYNSFVKEYQSLFGTDFKYTFEQIVHQKHGIYPPPPPINN